jgi:hypothetical protein
MTKLLERAISKVRQLPDDRQDELAEMLIEIASKETSALRLSAAQLADLDERLAGAPDYATDEETADVIARLTQ